MEKISYKTIRKNTRLTDFTDIKEFVEKNFVNKIPEKLKNKNTDTNMPLDVYY